MLGMLCQAGHAVLGTAPDTTFVSLHPEALLLLHRCAANTRAYGAVCSLWFLPLGAARNLSTLEQT